MSSGGGDGDFERQLERELARTARRLKPPSPAPSQSAYHRFAQSRRARSFFSAVATTSSKAAAGLVAACLLGAGGAAVATAATGTANPVVWGRTVTRAVTTCRDSRPAGQPGIGPCVSAVARQNGARARTSPGAPARSPSTGAPATRPSPLPVLPRTPGAASTHPSHPNSGAGGEPTRDPNQASNSQGSSRPTPQPAAGNSGQGAGSGNPNRGTTGRPPAIPAASPSARPTAPPRPSPGGPPPWAPSHP